MIPIVFQRPDFDWLMVPPPPAQRGALPVHAPAIPLLREAKTPVLAFKFDQDPWSTAEHRRASPRGLHRAGIEPATPKFFADIVLRLFN
jgi:hypothetical protein